MGTSRFRHAGALAFASLAILPCCAVPSTTRATPLAGAAAELTGLLRCFRGSEEQTLTQALDELAAADVVFVGELHDDGLTHRTELAILEGLTGRRPTALSLEMFERDEQDRLDRYLSGTTEESKFLDSIDSWKNYAVSYRPLIEFAKQARVPVIAANGPRTLLRKLSRGKDDAHAALDASERALVPREVFAARDAYWSRYDRIARAHGGTKGPATEDRRFWVQNLWDNTMAESIVDGHRRDPRRCVVHVCGAFHSAFDEGTVYQVRRRNPDLRVRTVTILPTHDLATIDASAEADRGDYVFYVERRMRDLFSRSKNFSVTIPSQLEWRFTPRLTTARDAPIVIWLPDRGLTTGDVHPWIDRQFKDEAHTLVVQPPDLVARDGAGRTAWYRGQLGFAAMRIRSGLQRILEYVRARGFGSDRVLVVGEGRGANLALAMARQARRLGWQTLALEPTSFDDIADAGTADPPITDRDRSITVVTAQPASYDRFLTLDRDVGISSRVVPLEAAGLDAHAIESAVRDQLSLRPSRSSSTSTPRLRTSDPTSRTWARPWQGHVSSQQVLDFAPLVIDGETFTPAMRREDVKRKGSVPRCVSPFGGTTVLLLPPHETAEGRGIWREVLASHPRRKTRWPIRLAAEEAVDGVPRLEDVLRKLAGDGAQQILVVPAEFRADPSRLRALRDRARSAVADHETCRVSWREGLGATCAAPSPNDS